MNIPLAYISSVPSVDKGSRRHLQGRECRLQELLHSPSDRRQVQQPEEPGDKELGGDGHRNEAFGFSSLWAA